MKTDGQDGKRRRIGGAVDEGIEQDRSKPLELDGPAGRALVSPLAAPSDEATAARLRWVLGGEVQEISLDPDLGPRLIPMQREGAELATLLLDAFDEAADTGQGRVRVCREGIEAFVDVPEQWERPGKSPSSVVGGDHLGPSDQRQIVARREKNRRVEMVLDAVGEGGAGFLQDYPRHRRSLAALRVRLENQVLRFDDLIRNRARGRWICLASALAGFGLALWGGLKGPVVLFAAGAALFFLAAAVLAYLGLVEPRLKEKKVRLERKLNRLTVRADELEESARTLALRAGYQDPWEVAATLRTYAERKKAAPPDLVAEDAILQRARSIAQMLGADPRKITAQSVQAGPRPAGSQGWPAEVSTLLPLESDSEGPVATPREHLEEILISMARLLERVERDLVQPWPLVLWDPWVDHGAEERANLLVALTKLAAPRAVLAVVSSN